MTEALIKLSRTVSHALRHAPDEYGIELDSQGWVDTAVLLQALANKDNRWQGFTEENLHAMAAAGEKQRYEFDENRIRAIYGHSVTKQVEYQAVEPPEILYHGTTSTAAKQILAQGLKPMKRQYVHLSPDVETASQVALRRTSRPVMLKIDAKGAFNHGVEFYFGNDNVWLSGKIPSSYIT